MGAGRSGSSSPGTLSVAVLALVMCLLVLAVAGAVVVHDGLSEWPEQRATRNRRPRRAHPRARAGVLLAVLVTGLGMVAGLALAAAVLALREAAG